MERLEIEDDNSSKPSVKRKIVTFYNKHKFPLTVEPLVFFYSLSYGLNEVLCQQQFRTISHLHNYRWSEPVYWLRRFARTSWTSQLRCVPTSHSWRTHSMRSRGMSLTTRLFTRHHQLCLSNIRNFAFDRKLINWGLHCRIFFALLAGTWSDHHGRKGLLLLSVFGQFLGSLSYGFNYMFLKELDWHFLFVELIIDICGGSVTYYMMEYSYMTDITQVYHSYLSISKVMGWFST